MIIKQDHQGNPFIGVFCVCCDKVAFVPEQVDDEFIKKIEDVLGVETARMAIDGSPLLGSLMVMNSRGIVVGDIATDNDIDKLSSWLKVGRVEDPLNAMGNNVMANDHGILAHEEISDESLDVLKSVLGVNKVARGTLGSITTVGAAGVVNNKGVLCHPKSSDEEKELAQDIFGVPAGIGTANFGSPLVGAAILCNSNGAVVGTKTTGVEMHRIEDILELY